MPAQTLLDVNPDDLFEKHSIPAIKNIQTEIRNEIEKKREELRTMVGEKCRDLLKAAETITEMKEMARNIVLGINQTKQLCQTFEEKKALGLSYQVKDSSTKLSNYTEETSKIIEIKIFLSLPEHIWTAIDSKDYLLGAQLFLFATHLHLGLEVSPSAQKISNKYPVVSKQWEIIRSCKKIIINGSHSQLKEIDLSSQKAAECLCSLVLLEVMPYEKLMTQFLVLRMTSLEDILRSEDLFRKKLRLTIQLLQHTFSILYACFLEQFVLEQPVESHAQLRDNSPSSKHLPWTLACFIAADVTLSEKPDKWSGIETQLRKVTGEEGTPTLSKIVQVSSLPEHYLSPLILNYRPNICAAGTSLSEDFIKTTLGRWLEKVKELLQVEITKLLLLLDDIKRLHKIIKEEVFSLEYPQNWPDVVHSVFGDNKLDIYDRFIKSHVAQRMKSLIRITWENNINNVLIHLTEMDEGVLKKRKKQPENDIRGFVWRENKMDTEEGLKLKTLGYTSWVMELCGLMNAFLSQLLEDVNLYIDENSSKSKTGNNDADLILPFLNSCSLEMLKSFVKRVKESYEERRDGNDESNLIVRARFLSSLTLLCPALEKCLQSEAHTYQEDFKENKTNNLWQEAVALLNEESIHMWDMWRALTSTQFQNLIKTKLDSKISLRNLLKSKPLSEIITIEEQTEDDTTVKSDLRVPSQPSLPLQDLLFQICQQLNAVAPHTLPKKIHKDLVDNLVKGILRHYEELSKSELIYQSQAWQMLLDVRFLTLVFVATENKDLSQSICDELEKKIDPFDLDVYFPHLQNSVKKSAQKLQGIFGILIDFPEKLPVFNGLKLHQTNSKVEEPNLLAVSTNVPWFPLLPVTKFGFRRSDDARLDIQDPSSSKEFSTEKPGLRGKEKENKKESVTSDFFKSAGAFFDAMTGGWS